MTTARRPVQPWHVMAVSVALIAACGTAGTSPSTAIGPTPSTGIAPTPSTASAAPSEPAAPSGQGTWLPAGTMAIERGAFRAVPLLDGRVLVVGDDNDCAPGGPWDDSATTEIYDPADDSWTQTAPLDQPRGDFAAVSLPDGRVLVAGGQSGGARFAPLGSTRLWDPVGQAWEEGGWLGTARVDPAAAVLADGRVLLAGGWLGTDPVQGLSTAEIYDPSNGTVTPSAAMTRPRSGGTAMTMRDGRVVLLGGSDPGDAFAPVRSIDRYDPETDTWAVIADLPEGQRHTAVMLDDGTILLAGGQDDGNAMEDQALRTAWRLDPMIGVLTPLAPMPTPRRGAMATLLADGRVLLAGGADGTVPAASGTFVLIDTSSASPRVTASAVIYDPATDQWVETEPMPSPAMAGISVGLQDGSVLVAGGATGWGPASQPWCPNLSASAARFVPGAP